jgi:hypothetical protein
MKARSFLVLVFALMAGGCLLNGQGTARIVGVVSKALDYESLDRNTSLPQNSLNLARAYGPADCDHRHVFFATFLVEIPLPGKSGLVSKFTQG